MKERPILFSAPMVRAILDGTKTQTRRVVKGIPDGFRFDGFITEGPRGYAGKAVWSPSTNFKYCTTGGVKVACPYGQPGDRLWVKETFMAVPRIAAAGHVIAPRVYYRATDEAQTKGLFHTWNPSIHMFRKFSRITLEVVSVRVERLQEISEADARAEGIVSSQIGSGDTRTGLSTVWGLGGVGDYAPSAKIAYSELWESINGLDSWDANPWVWVVEFRRVES
jgi:hypothetical protein